MNPLNFLPLFLHYANNVAHGQQLIAAKFNIIKGEAYLIHLIP
jgi:hypothetical protein